MHIPVLLHEAIDALDIQKGETFLDGTLGRAGHSSLVAERHPGDVLIIALDKDKAALEESEERLRTLGAKYFLKQESFGNLRNVLSELEIPAVDAILFDLGISTNQLEESARGFSFQKNEPLLMTMMEEAGEGDLTAKLILNTFDEKALELIIRGFGEESYSRQIARKIVELREEKPFETTEDLVEAVRAATPPYYHRGRLHPATRTFQALRIAVNEELGTLEKGLSEGFEALSPNGRFAVISFHSLEDRIVKNFFRDLSHEGKAKLITKKPIVPTEEEIERNPRSRSAKLRVIEKII